MIHGGGWNSGDRTMLYPMATELAANGYVAFTVDYRLSPEAKFPAAIFDLKYSVKWLKANAEKYNIDTNKIAILGCSAGGTLASFVGATINNSEFEPRDNSPDYSTSLQAIINIDGILDFTHPAESGKDTDPENASVGKQWLGNSYKENPQIWIDASPLTYVNDKTPPMLFINSSIDRFHAGRDEAIQILNENNIYNEVHTISDTPHSFWLFEPWFDETMRLTLNFLDNQFKK
jgi:pectinesterase